MTVRAKLRLLRRRFTRRRRLVRAYRELELREIPTNRWEMSKTEDAEFHRIHDKFLRDFRRVSRVAVRWGFRPA